MKRHSRSIRIDAPNLRKRPRLAIVLRCAPLLASGGLLPNAVPLVAAEEVAEIQVITREGIERSGAINAAALLSQVSANLIGRTVAKLMIRTGS